MTTPPLQHQRCIPWNFAYRQAFDFQDHVTSYHQVQVLKFVPEISFLLLVEVEGRTVKFLTKGCK